MIFYRYCSDYLFYIYMDILLFLYNSEKMHFCGTSLKSDENFVYKFEKKRYNISMRKI